MKTIKGIIGVAAVALVCVSCKKEKNAGENWSCTCSYTWNGKSQSATATYPNTTRMSAQEDCDKRESYYQSLSGKSGAYCALGN